MILVCGIPTETPIAMVCDQLANLGYDYVLFNQRKFTENVVDFEISKGKIRGRIQLGKYRYRLEEFSGVYTRLMNDQILPELKNEPPSSPKRVYSHALNDTLMRWIEVAPCRVVNRTGPMGSNHSKPYQAQLIRQQGFKTPETLITNDPALVKKFLQKHKRIIYKSISSMRSIVQILEDQDLKRLDQIRWCPVQFQKYIEGTNIRVHTIGGKVFATSIKTSVTDYRYSNVNEHETVNLEPFNLTEKLKKMCLKLSKSLKLDFAGIDLKIDNKKRVYCFEVNPSPGYSYYESQTGQPISRTLAQYLAQNN